MSKQFNVSYLVSALLSVQREKKLLTHPTRLTFTGLCGLALIGLWQFVMAPPIHSNVVTAADVPLSSCANLGVSKTVSDPTPNVGDIIAYTITVTNHGPQKATRVQLTDVLPTGVTLGGYTATQGTYNSTTGLWTVGNLDNTASATLTITATVDSGTCGMTITNTASVTANQPDPEPDNNADSANIDVLCPRADLEVVKTVSDPTPNVGDVITYTITVTNNGPDDATGVQLTDTLPTGVTFGGYTATQGTYTSTTGLWEITTDDDDDLPAGAVATLIITATVDSSTCGTTITNTANILSADQPDPNPTNNEASVNIDVLCTGADLEVAKTVSDPTPNVGEVIAYTITVVNNGPDDATGVRLADALPAGVTFGRYTATQGFYISTTGLWTVGDIDCGASATLTINATVNSCRGAGIITNTAHSLTADQPDPNPDNNVASAVITSTSVHCLYLPIICRHYEPTICNPYYDDFSDSNSGWPIDTNGEVRTGYSAGEYFIQRQKEGMRIVQAPVSFANRYTVEVDARWDNAYIGYEYGLIFGQTGFPYPTYRFGVHPINQQYTLRYNPGNGWQCITQPCWVDPSIPNSINPGSTSNHLKVECDRETVSLYINNSLLWQDSSYSCRGQVGLFAQSSPTTPNALAYFDNFQVSCPFGTSSLNIIESNMSPVSTMSMDFEFDE